MLMRSKVICQGQGSSEVKLGGKCWFCVSFEKFKSDWNQTWIKGAIGVPLNVNEFKCYEPRSRVI